MINKEIKNENFLEKSIINMGFNGVIFSIYNKKEMYY